MKMNILPLQARNHHAPAHQAAEMSSRCGFLPPVDPLRCLPSAFEEWEDAATQLPKLLVSDRTRSALEKLPPFPLEGLTNERERERALTLLGFLGHAYVWCGEEPARVLPERLATPWHAVASSLGLPPVLTYSSYVLQNYQRFDANEGIALGNLAVIQNLVGGLDEEGFVLIHVALERQAAPAMAALPACLDAALQRDAALLERRLTIVQTAIEAMYANLRTMREWCDPYVYYHRIRPYLNGWKGHPALVSGLIYEGVTVYGGAPQQFRGPTGAQSAVFAALDLVLGISHRNDGLGAYLREMRTYMPPAQRAFLAFLEGRESVRPFVERAGSDGLTDLYNACVEGIERFRSLHLEYAAAYISRQAQPSSRNPQDLGTGGTHFIKDLKERRCETAMQRIQKGTLHG